ncbi:hypothetical protein Plhal304r1_c010g0038891 [Plasmopara halstedii]
MGRPNLEPILVDSNPLLEPAGYGAGASSFTRDPVADIRAYSPVQPGPPVRSVHEAVCLFYPRWPPKRILQRLCWVLFQEFRPTELQVKKAVI